MFNGLINLVPMAICVMLGALYYDYMLELNGFKPKGSKISVELRLAYGFCFFLSYGMSLLCMLICT